jgi:predicted negative regulator of RcsB-dependent stress response
VGLYYSDASPAVNSAYQQALDTRTIGERVAKPANRDEMLAGNVWFYYGARYGEYLSITHSGNPEDYLPATLEGSPASSDAYFTLADYYRDAGQPDAALEDFAHALELNSKRGDAHDRRAQILWQQGKQEEAVKEWSLALAALRAQEDSRSVPPTFWTDLGATLENIGERKLLPRLRDDADRILRAYVRRNGYYRAAPILRSALAAAGDPAQGADWLVDLSRAAQSPLAFLSELVSARWFPKDRKDPVYQKILALAQDRVTKTFGAEHSSALETLHHWQLRWIDFLLDNRRTADAQNAFNNLAEDFRNPRQPGIASIMIRLAVQSNKLEELLRQFQQAPEKAPASDILRNAALSLEEEDAANARRLLEYVYMCQIEEHDFAPANFLGLAEVRLQQSDLAQAVALLQRMNRVAGQPFENLAAAGDLLVKMGHPVEATEFYSMRAKAVPWDADARLKLAQAEAAANAQRNDAIQLLTSVASSPSVSYAKRASAAESLAPLKAPAASLGSAELEWLVRGGPAAGAESPGFFFARLRAAREASDAITKIRLLLDAIALRPEDFSQRFGASPPTATNPEGVSPRILLAQAAATANQNELAVSAITPLLDQNATLSPPPESPLNEAGGGETEQPEYRSDMWKSFLAGQDLSASQKSLIAAQLAGAFQKLDRLEEAARLWKVASMLATDDSLRAQASHELERVQAQLKLEQADQERQPVISNHLEQRGLVRPRPVPEVSGPGRAFSPEVRGPKARALECGSAATALECLHSLRGFPVARQRGVKHAPPSEGGSSAAALQGGLRPQTGGGAGQ